MGCPSLSLVFINFFNQLKGATNFFLGVPPRSFFLPFDSRIRISEGYAAATYKVLTDECQKLNSSDNTDQGRFLIHIRDFTVLDRNPNQGFHRFTLK